MRVSLNSQTSIVPMCTLSLQSLGGHVSLHTYITHHNIYHPNIMGDSQLFSNARDAYGIHAPINV